MRTGRCITVTVPLSHHFLKHSEPQIPHAPSASSFPPLGWFAVLHGGVEGRTKRPGMERGPETGGAQGAQEAHPGSWSWAGAGQSGAGRLQQESTATSDSLEGPRGR